MGLAGALSAAVLVALGVLVLVRAPAQRWYAVPLFVASAALLTASLADHSKSSAEREDERSSDSSASDSSTSDSSETTTSRSKKTTSTTTSTSSTTTTTASSSSAGNDITALGEIRPESTTDGFPAAFLVDGDPETSWLSGPAAADDGASEVAWLSEEHLLTSIRITPTRLAGKGFTSVEFDVVAGEGETVYTETVPITGPDDVVITPNIRGRAVLVVLRGHQDPNGSGFAELHIEGT